MLFGDFHDPRPARGSTLVRPLLGNQLPVPPKDGVGGDERLDLGESPSPDRLAAHGESAALRVGQTKSPATKLLFEDAVLFPEVVDCSVLLAGDPTGHRCHEDLPRMEHCRHPPIVAKSKADRQLST